MTVGDRGSKPAAIMKDTYALACLMWLAAVDGAEAAA